MKKIIMVIAILLSVGIGFTLRALVFNTETKEEIETIQVDETKVKVEVVCTLYDSSDECEMDFQIGDSELILVKVKNGSALIPIDDINSTTYIATNDNEGINVTLEYNNGKIKIKMDEERPLKVSIFLLE